MKRLRLWLLARAYKRVSRLERKLQYTVEAREMRAEFFRETWRAVENMGHANRGARRRARRELVNGNK